VMITQIMPVLAYFGSQLLGGGLVCTALCSTVHLPCHVLETSPREPLHEALRQRAVHWYLAAQLVITALCMALCLWHCRVAHHEWHTMSSTPRVAHHE